MKKRRRKASTSPASTKTHYFTSETQDAIVEFKATLPGEERKKIYVDRIHPAFVKLSENLINIYKFKTSHASFDELKNDCVNFLFENVEKFDASRGTNAFSYFNVVAKNWLIVKTKQKTRKNISIDDVSTHYDQDKIDEYCSLPSQEELYEGRNKQQKLLKSLIEIRTKVKTDNELSCINSIITICEQLEEIDILSKSAILLYMREQSKLSSKQLMIALQGIKKIYRRFKLDPNFEVF